MSEGVISILLGSGFSRPEGLPGVAEINEKLRTIKETEFYLLSDQRAGFYHSDWRDPNGWMPGSYLDRLFLEKFTAFYCSEYLAGSSKYNYETFYDFMSEFERFKREKEKIDVFCDSFNGEIKSNIYRQNSYNWVARAKRIVNQLIADLLVLPKHYENAGYSNYPNYGGIFGLIREWLKDNIVHVHTLNHDLFFDFIGSHLTDLWQHYSDGYTEYGSSVYGQVMTTFNTDRGKIHKEYKVRLQYYSGQYENNLRLYKLHGSVNSYVLRTQHGNEEIRVKKDFGVSDFLMEKFNKESNKYKYEAVFTDTYPDFLTGTTEKIRQYNIPFYDSLFTHFKNNLLKSAKLLIIGYGFQDKAINEFIENHYLIYRKPVFVIDVKKPESELIVKYGDQISLMLHGVSNYPYNKLMQTVY